eukprot:TRINITY_DN12033_c0_g1_i1.p1 TRINITY_DN12033_c0_g1~~TRINITY_DN12033_c0_g1_i1.p1  ORF type:complete len:387 (-),score=69.49 TRINITY_DN12033_c0_g1_i1:190-1350(-)
MDHPAAAPLEASAQPENAAPAPRAPRERVIGEQRACGAAAEQSKGLKYGAYVPTQREIDSGEYVVQEVVAIARAEGVETEHLEPLEDWDAAVKEVSTTLFTKDWNLRFDILHCARKVIKYQPARITELIADIGKCLLECLKNPRSSILREACMLSADLLTSAELMSAVCDRLSFDKLVPVLLLKSISDKKFIRDASLDALHSHANSAPQMFKEYLVSTEHKNSKVAGSAAHVVTLCLELLCTPEGAGLDEHFTDVANRMVRVCLHAKLADTRKSGKRCLELLEQKAGGDVLREQLAAQCSPHDVEAVHRLLHPEDVVVEPCNTTLADLIANSSPSSSPKHSPVGAQGVQDVNDPFGDVVVETVETRARRGSTPRERRTSEEVLQMF